MPPLRPSLPPPPAPTREIFDPWNSASTGHQRAENRLSGSTSWRDSRSYKLSHQFRDKSGEGGTGHLSDLVGAGSENFGKDGRKENGDWEKGAPGLRERGWQDIRGLMTGVSKKRQGDFHDELDNVKKPKTTESALRASEASGDTITSESQSYSKPLVQLPSVEDMNDGINAEEGQLTSNLFAGLNFYLNGSTAPLIGDHKLKCLLASHGANVSIALGRRTVTHVILGTPNAPTSSSDGHNSQLSGAGGGLAASKIQKEVQRVGGKGVKFVGVEWVLESIKAGKRLPEARFANLHVAPKGQRSVYGMFGGVSNSERPGGGRLASESR